MSWSNMTSLIPKWDFKWVWCQNLELTKLKKKNRRKLSKAHPSSGPRPVFSDLKSLGSVSFWNLKSRYYRPYFEKLYLIICRCDSVIGNINGDHLAVYEIDKYWKLAANVSPKRKKLQNEVMTLLTCLSLRAFLSSSCTFSCWPVWIIRKWANISKCGKNCP